MNEPGSHTGIPLLLKLGYNIIYKESDFQTSRRSAMRKLTIFVSALVGSLLISVVPILSAENTPWKEFQLPKKDECLLLAKNCQDNAYVLQQRIDRLRGEIYKGTTVYTHDELNTLRRKLDDANKALEFVLTESGV
jgi:hypothetical protein